MKTTKTLNVHVAIHQAVKLKAVELGVPLGDYTDALLAIGLAHPKEVMQLLASRTSSEQLPGIE